MTGTAAPLIRVYCEGWPESRDKDVSLVQPDTFYGLSEVMVALLGETREGVPLQALPQLGRCPVASLQQTLTRCCVPRPAVR